MWHISIQITGRLLASGKLKSNLPLAAPWSLSLPVQFGKVTLRHWEQCEQLGAYSSTALPHPRHSACPDSLVMKQIVWPNCRNQHLSPSVMGDLLIIWNCCHPKKKKEKRKKGGRRRKINLGSLDKNDPQVLMFLKNVINSAAREHMTRLALKTSGSLSPSYTHTHTHTHTCARTRTRMHTHARTHTPTKVHTHSCLAQPRVLIGWHSEWECGKGGRGWRRPGGLVGLGLGLSDSTDDTVEDAKVLETTAEKEVEWATSS